MSYLCTYRIPVSINCYVFHFYWKSSVHDLCIAFFNIFIGYYSCCLWCTHHFFYKNTMVRFFLTLSLLSLFFLLPKVSSSRFLLVSQPRSPNTGLHSEPKVRHFHPQNHTWVSIGHHLAPKLWTFPDCMVIPQIFFFWKHFKNTLNPARGLSLCACICMCKNLFVSLYIMHHFKACMYPCVIS